MSTSFIQFQYCEICRVNHKKGRKHVYSTHHQTVVQNILKKFGKKMSDARSELDSPVIQDYAWETGANFWCYFCAAEFPKHSRLDTVTLKNGGLIEHCVSEDHKCQMSIFCRKHHVEKEKQLEFVFTEEEHQRFKESAIKAVHSFEDKNNKRRKLESNKIRWLESQRQQLVWQHTNISHESPRQIFKPSFESRYAWSQPSGGGGRNDGMMRDVRTAEAHGEGLTCVRLKSYDRSVGNMYTGATPPWLQDKANDHHGNTGIIGPTMEDYKKHLHQEQKRKLPANRVGADFNRHGNTSDTTWLPSFGGVWNKGRRADSKHQFLKHGGTSLMSKAIIHNSKDRATTGVPNTVKPYQRKRKAESTVTSDQIASGTFIPVSVQLHHGSHSS